VLFCHFFILRKFKDSKHDINVTTTWPSGQSAK